MRRHEAQNNAKHNIQLRCSHNGNQCTSISSRINLLQFDVFIFHSKAQHRTQQSTAQHRSAQCSVVPARSIIGRMLSSM